MEIPESGHLHHQGFIRKYIFSEDHKTIGKQFLWLGLIMMVVGGATAMMMRWQLAWPESQVPLTGWIPEPFMYDDHMGPEFYNMLFTMHATIMVFFVVMPILVLSSVKVVRSMDALYSGAADHTPLSTLSPAKPGS